MKGTTNIKTQVRTGTRENANVSDEVSKAGVYTIAVASAAIGIWGLACFVGGLVASGGPFAFVGNWFRAVSGM